MSGMKRVRAYIENLCTNLFTRRQLIAVDGRRGVVDNVLARLLVESVIERVATGVYSLRKNQIRTPTAADIAHLRVKAFGKQVVLKIGDDQFNADHSNSRSFYTNGCRTSFMSIHGRIVLKAIAPRYCQKSPQADSPRPVLAPEVVAPERECRQCVLRRSGKLKEPAGRYFFTAFLAQCSGAIRRLLSRLHPR